MYYLINEEPLEELPKNFTGKVISKNKIFVYLKGKLHCESGPAEYNVIPGKYFLKNKEVDSSIFIKKKLSENPKFLEFYEKYKNIQSRTTIFTFPFFTVKATLTHDVEFNETEVQEIYTNTYKFQDETTRKAFMIEGRLAEEALYCYVNQLISKTLEYKTYKKEIKQFLATATEEQFVDLDTYLYAE